MVNIYIGYFKVLNVFTVILPKGGVFVVINATQQLSMDHPRSSSRAQFSLALKPASFPKSSSSICTAEEFHLELIPCALVGFRKHFMSQSPDEIFTHSNSKSY